VPNLPGRQLGEALPPVPPNPLSAWQAPGRGAASAFHEFPDSPIDAPAPAPAPPRGGGRARRRPNGHIGAAPYHHMPTLSEHGDIGVRRHSDSDISAEPPALWCAACPAAPQEANSVARILPVSLLLVIDWCATLQCPGSPLSMQRVPMQDPCILSAK